MDQGPFFPGGFVMILYSYYIVKNKELTNSMSPEIHLNIYNNVH